MPEENKRIISAGGYGIIKILKLPTEE